MDRKRGHLTKNFKNASSSLIWIKVVGLGSTGAGKTSLIKHFCESKFSEAYQATIGVDYGFKVQNVQGVDVRVHLWDLSGGSEYVDVRNELYVATDAIFLVFDATSTTSFESLDMWYQELTKYKVTSVEMCLVANKVDLQAKRMLSANEGKKWAASHNMQYFETSCASGEGIQEVFKSLLQNVLKKKSVQLKETT